ncbi:precorrin-3B C(17)-methyltransferase [Leptospira borgpetersenii]|uniref:precorrin-3B C(17)-methyltransferase n=1 Tax=Leptospira borgpetersenii TaxID=174 RepID=UPI0021597330|nr:precorrin-3B C(17)-methyltransferase [Leptospira borgpetersenii]UVD74760.1 precorrin-3B C(17)-methyltransferase [Leptospira borgpetersenii]UVD77944.1 precorrin-3B C(17)-methyltransferase [Leptospira borgpetersenii]UZW34513.1 precorrin-3B C(17)-methyltransferase [Leptospira borgpetersenii]
MQIGRLNIVGIGPGNDIHITPAVLQAIQEADLVIGYATYIGLVKHHLVGKQVTQTGMTEEVSRAQTAIDTAKEGKIVTLISSGDAGVYGMAGLVFEILQKTGWKKGDSPEIKMIPGITADSSCASLIGAPLVHDTARISLSDLLTPWSVIENRLECAAKGDFVITLYNPASGRRQRQIVEAVNIIKRHRSGTTPVALVKSAYRKQQNVQLSDLDNFLDYEIGMNTTVIVGSSNTFVYEDFMITPRGYTNKYSLKDSSLKKGQKKGFSLRSTGDLQSKVNSDNGDRHLSLNITKIHGAFVKRSTTIMDSSAAKAVESLNLLSQIQKQNAKKDSKSVDFQKNTLSYIGRLGGGILFKSLEKFYIVGKIKVPIRFKDYGFADPEEYGDRYFELKIIEIKKVRNLQFEFLMFIPNEISPQEIYEKLVIYRNSSASERLITYVKNQSEKVFLNGQEYTDISWLGTVPSEVWNLVRGVILKC